MVYLLVGCRWLIGMIFLASAASKLRDRRSRAEFVAATARLAPARLLRLAAADPVPTGALRVSVGVLAAEIAVPALLVVPATARVGSGLATGLLVSFTAAIWWAFRRGARIACGCFATSTSPVGPRHVVRNLVLASAALAALAPVPPAAAGPAGVVLAAIAAAVVAALLLFTDDLVELFR